MIEQVTIDGKKATVAYLNDDMTPATKEDHTLVKVIFEDGTLMFGRKEQADDKVPN